jgi:3-hydroxyacyl-[acyl-carrier-protein] dehydratase
MRFTLVDRIIDLTPGQTITTVKNLTMAEEYLAEHFPSFPVMPGVLMLEAITQAGAWLVRVTENFKNPVVLLREAKTVKFGQFVTPGKQLTVTCEQLDDDGECTILKAKGQIDGQTSVSAKVVLARFCLAARNPIYRRDDQRLRAFQIRTFQMLATPELRQSLADAAMPVPAGQAPSA